MFKLLLLLLLFNNLFGYSINNDSDESILNSIFVIFYCYYREILSLMIINKPWN